MQRVQVLTEFTYDQIDRKRGDIFEMEDAHAQALELLSKVMKAEDDSKPQNTAHPSAAVNRRYKRRDLRAEE